MSLCLMGVMRGAALDGQGLFFLSIRSLVNLASLGSLENLGSFDQ